MGICLVLGKTDVYHFLVFSSGFIRECKLTALRSLQYCCLLIQPYSRHLLQVLVKFIVRLSNNHSIVLSDDLPTRELVRGTVSDTVTTTMPCPPPPSPTPLFSNRRGIHINKS